MDDQARRNSNELIRACLRRYLTGTPLPPELPPAVDWQHFLAIADKQRLAPILAGLLAEYAVPPSVLKQLEDKTRQRRIRAMVMTEAFVALQRQFVRADIPLIPLKGLALAHTHYPSVTARYFDDLDLLIPAAKAESALKVLRGAGFIPHPNADRPEWHHLAPHVHPGHGTLVELHLDLYRRTAPGWDLAGVWQRATPGRLAGAETLILHPRDALINTLVHGRHNLYRRLTTLVDSALILGAMPEADLAALPAALGEARVVSAFSQVQALLAQELGVAPRLPGVNASAWRQALQMKIAGWAHLEPKAGNLANGPLGRLMELGLQDSLADGARLGWRLIVPPAAFVQESYGDPAARRALPATYLRRLVRRAGAATRQVGDR